MIEIKCKNPAELVKKIKEYLQKPKDGFSVDEDGDICYFDTCYEQGTYDRVIETPTEFSHAMWFKEIIKDENTLIYRIVLSNKDKLTKASYSFYHSTLARILLNNFDEDFDSIIISSQLDKEYDNK